MKRKNENQNNKLEPPTKKRKIERVSSKNIPIEKRQKLGDRMFEYLINNHIECYDDVELKDFISSINNDEEKLFKKVIQLYKFKRSIADSISRLRSWEYVVDDSELVVDDFEKNFLQEIFDDEFMECETCYSSGYGWGYKNSYRHISKQCEFYNPKL